MDDPFHETINLWHLLLTFYSPWESRSTINAVFSSITYKILIIFFPLRLTRRPRLGSVQVTLTPHSAQESPRRPRVLILRQGPAPVKLRCYNNLRPDRSHPPAQHQTAGYRGNAARKNIFGFIGFILMNLYRFTEV